MVKKVLVVVDSKNSAIGISASQRVYLHDWQLVSALDFSSPSKFLKHLQIFECDVILFAWRQSLIDLVNTSGKKEEFTQFFMNKEIFFVINDHLGLHPKFRKHESLIHTFANGYFVTSELLLQDYSQILTPFHPSGIYPDLPDIRLIEKIRSESISKDPNKIVWIGNSSWGKHFGYNDHKGLNEIIIPLKQSLKKDNPQFSFEIIDSASGIRHNEEILRRIASASVLIQSSESEGTGMPLLEALALGTIPISTRVGIAETLLGDAFPDNLISRDVNSFFTEVLRLMDQSLAEKKRMSIRASNIYDVYLGEAIKPLFFNVKNLKSCALDPSLIVSLKSYIYWGLRFLKKRLRSKTSKLSNIFNAREKRSKHKVV